MVIDLLQNITKGLICDYKIGFVDMTETVAFAGNGFSHQLELMQNLVVQCVHRNFLPTFFFSVYSIFSR